MNTDGMSQSQVEAKGIEWAKSLLQRWLAKGTSLIDTQTSRRAEFMQRTVGDFIATLADGVTRNIEVKTERRHTGNLFIETWSNRTTNTEFRRDGWIYTLQADWLLYTFLDVEVIYLVPLTKLKEWCIYEGNAFRYSEKTAGASLDGRQRNVTIGHPIPVDDLRTAVGIHTYKRDFVTGLWLSATIQEMRK